MAHILASAVCFSQGCSCLEMVDTLSVECFSLNKFTSDLSLCLSLNSFFHEPLRTRTSSGAKTRFAASVERLWVLAGQVLVSQVWGSNWVLTGHEFWHICSSSNLRYMVSLGRPETPRVIGALGLVNMTRDELWKNVRDQATLIFIFNQEGQGILKA